MKFLEALLLVSRDKGLHGGVLGYAHELGAAVLGTNGLELGIGGRNKQGSHRLDT